MNLSNPPHHTPKKISAYTTGCVNHNLHTYWTFKGVCAVWKWAGSDGNISLSFWFKKKNFFSEHSNNWMYKLQSAVSVMCFFLCSAKELVWFVTSLNAISLFQQFTIHISDHTRFIVIKNVVLVTDAELLDHGATIWNTCQLPGLPLQLLQETCLSNSHQALAYPAADSHSLTSNCLQSDPLLTSQ
jgi:hypothetical protein